MKQLILSISCSAFFTGCASEPIIDERGVDPARYEADLADCRSYSEQVDTVGQAAKHGAAGAVVGAIAGAVLDGASAEDGAAGGALIGAVQGGAEAQERKEQVFRNCMDGRGYQVLG